MEPYKLLEAPRKTVKIIISIAETAHLSLQPSGRQTSRGQCCAQQNIHKHTRGKAKEGRTAVRSHALNKHTTNCSCCLSWLLSATLIWDFCVLSPFCWNGGSVLPVFFLPRVIPCTLSREKCRCKVLPQAHQQEKGNAQALLPAPNTNPCSAKGSL